MKRPSFLLLLVPLLVAGCVPAPPTTQSEKPLAANSLGLASDLAPGAEVVERGVETRALAAAVKVVGHHADPVEQRRHLAIQDRVDAARARARGDRQEPARANGLAKRRKQQHVVARIVRTSASTRETIWGST